MLITILKAVFCISKVVFKKDKYIYIFNIFFILISFVWMFDVLFHQKRGRNNIRVFRVGFQTLKLTVLYCI